MFNSHLKNVFFYCVIDNKLIKHNVKFKQSSVSLALFFTDFLCIKHDCVNL